MKSRFKTRKVRKNYLIYLVIISIFLYLNYKYLDNSKIKINNKEIVEFLIDNNSYIKEKINNIVTINKEEEIINTNIDPLIYIYNTHQGEEYAGNILGVKPTVMIGDYILEDLFKADNIKVLVEEKSIKKILKENNWNYSYSYKASRILLEEAIKNNPSLKYFIDIHRDSLGHDRTTVTIDNKDYAKIMFLIGLENPNYQENLDFSEYINDIIEEKYPKLSKGIYKKKGPGVNGVYNQDFSKYTILIEVGGNESSADEVLNTIIAFKECFLEAITNYDK